jgi:carbamoyltransferase
MYVLGINAFHGDVSAVLIHNGELVAALEEERFRRVKHWAGFPTHAIRKCLELAGISGEAIDHVAVSRKPRANVGRKIQFLLRYRPAPRFVMDRFSNARHFRGLNSWVAEALQLPESRLPPLHAVEHHPAHLASAFLVSPFERAAVAAVDGFGDFVSTSLAEAQGTDIRIIDRVYFPHSLGMLYTALTQYLGFPGYGDEFKVMGLSPYGRPRYVDQLRHLIHLKRGGLFELNLSYYRHWKSMEMEWLEGYPKLGLVYSSKLEELLGPARKPESPLTERHEDLAASLQALYEECFFHVLDRLWRAIKNPRLCLAGGCAMNSVANGKIRANTKFEEVYIQPAAADNGTALGAAYHVWNSQLRKPRTFVMDHGYWGTSYPDAVIDVPPTPESDARWNYRSQVFKDEEALCRSTAQLLAEGNVVGWFQGRMEWGARALGNRSILADPRRADMRDLINSKIKFREKFRPFAPAILENRLAEYFEDAAVDPFMQQVYPIKADRRSELPAVTHVDGSGRLQTVNEAANPRFFRLITEFDKITGTPVLLNTSFNENEPIVDTPEQAFDCFLRTQMDAIVVNNTIVRRIPADARTVAQTGRESGEAGSLPILL